MLKAQNCASIYLNIRSPGSLLGFQVIALAGKGQVILVHAADVAGHAHAELFHGDALHLEEPLVRVEPTTPGLGPHALHPLRPQVVAGQHEGHALALVEPWAGEELAAD